MFNSFIFKIARRYFFARSSKTIVNRINRFAFIMIVVSACSLLVVLSAFSGLKDFGLLYTNSFDPDFKVIPKVGKHFVLDGPALEKVSSLSGTSIASLVLEEKVLLANSLNSTSIVLKGVDSNHFLNQQLDSRFKQNTIKNENFPGRFIPNLDRNNSRIGIGPPRLNSKRSVM